MKRTIAVLIICLMIIPSLGVISKSNQKDYTYDHLRYFCTDGNGFNEAKYQRMVQMYESKKESQPFNEADSITQDSNLIESVSSDDGLMDSAWPMKCHNTKHTGLSPYSTDDNNGAELWKFEAETWIEGGPAISTDGTIYFGDHAGFIYALNPDGTLKWRYDEAAGGTVTSVPAIDEDGTIFLGDWDQYLRALYPNGTLKWKAYGVGTIASSPAIGEDGTIYFGTMYGGDRGYIVAIRSDGTRKWSYRTDYYITSDPVIGDDGTIYIGSGDTYFYALNPDGSLKWRYKTGHYIKGPASIDNGGIIYVGSWDDYLYAFYANGTLKWKCKVGTGTETNPSFGPDGTIYVGGNVLWAIRTDGSVKWTFRLGKGESIFQSCPAISNEGIIYFGSFTDGEDGNLYAVNPNGTLRWYRKLANLWINSPPSIGDDGIIYIGSSFDYKGDDWGYLFAIGQGEHTNNPPNIPTITGPSNGKILETYSYTISATDIDGDDLSYFVDWGDSSNSNWQGYYSSGLSLKLSHSWDSKGTYSIRAKSRDDDGAESDWSTLEVTMPKYKVSLWEWLMERWLFIKWILEFSFET